MQCSAVQCSAVIMQAMKTREAQTRWREETKRRIKEKEAQKEGQDQEQEEKHLLPSPPYACDPDWSLALCGLGEAAGRSRLRREVGREEEREVEVLEEELGREVREAVVWAGRPGQEGEARRGRRSARILRLGRRLDSLRRSAGQGRKVEPGARTREAAE